MSGVPTTPDGAPDGCEIKFVSFWQARPKITPRLLIVHTNAASGEGSIESSSNWAEAAPGSNTLPHYQVDRAYNSRGVIARKMLPTDRKGIGNGTVSASNVSWSSLSLAQRTEIQQHGPAALFSLVIETADLGYGTGKPGDSCHFTSDQAEMVARIIAYESELWGFPVEYPDTWHGTGVACHTEPFDFPFWSIYKGKTCPGSAKKGDMKAVVMPRAVAILDPEPPPPPPPPPEEPVTHITMLCAPNDVDTQVAFAYNGESIWWIPHAEARDAGLWLGWWQYNPDTKDYYRNFSKAQLQSLIDTCWAGGTGPPQFRTPA